MTQERLADLSGVSRGTIALLETGKLKTTTIETLMKLAGGLKVPLTELTRTKREEAAAAEFVKVFLDSGLATASELTTDDLEWLKGLTRLSWGGRKPTAETFFFMLQGWRKSIAEAAPSGDKSDH
jgi:transcriptional regulator with XRE-family HTH domain